MNMSCTYDSQGSLGGNGSTDRIVFVACEMTESQKHLNKTTVNASTMKHKLICILIIIILLFIAGCGMIPKDPEAFNDSSDESNDTIVEPEVTADDIIEQIAVKEKQKPVENNITNITINVSAVSGSLDLQQDIELCPHLARSFSCNRYDVRHCDINTIVGRDQFWPDLINCRTGRLDGEDPDNRYCLVQECQPLHNDSIVDAYGGPTIFAEYEYREEKVGGGIMTHYTLKECGEVFMEFKSKFDCVVFKSNFDGWNSGLQN
ncbi:hypothetical protein HQ545_06695 [Candidatus Woesearchaeota archaeon]|nr:hypothetical protein [Candidatus Woesearchaeota archaeon]